MFTCVGLQVLKWNFIELRGEFVEQLRGQMEKNFSPTIMAQLFHSDFKQHIKAIEQLIVVTSCSVLCLITFVVLFFVLLTCQQQQNSSFDDLNPCFKSILNTF